MQDGSEKGKEDKGKGEKDKEHTWCGKEKEIKRISEKKQVLFW